MRGQNSGVGTDVMVAIYPTPSGFGESSVNALAESGVLAADKFPEMIKGITVTQNVSAVSPPEVTKDRPWFLLQKTKRLR